MPARCNRNILCVVRFHEVCGAEELQFSWFHAEFFLPLATAHARNNSYDGRNAITDKVNFHPCVRSQPVAWESDRRLHSHRFLKCGAKLLYGFKSARRPCYSREGVTLPTLKK